MKYSFIIPSNAVQLLSAGEDRRFFSHKGYDVIGITRAIRNYVFYLRIEGASTIEQQLVRVLTRRYERTFKRKLKEIILACVISKLFEKELLAKAYLYYAYYGWKMNGLVQACATQKKDLNDMNEMDLALLIARMKYPEPRNASIHIKEKIRRRAEHIIAMKNRYCSSVDVVREAHEAI